MTRAEIAKIVSRVKYRSWKFTIDDSGDIQVRARVQNAYSQKPRTAVVNGYVVSPQQYADETSLLVEIYDAISGILHHEAQEWFKYKGRRIFDPHA